MNDKQDPIERFGALLDRHGSDFERWPTESKAWGRILVGSNHSARILHREAAALEAVLDHASRPAQKRISALADRILTEAATEALHSPRSVHAPSEPSNVVALPIKNARLTSPSPQPTQSSSANRAGVWRATASLAASLLIGIMIGSLEFASLPLSRFIEFAEVGQDVELFASALVADSTTPALDEDYL